jgi:drug/metabolite transporter (DMT)-like permease
MTFVYTALALTAFAANSLLCRLALGGASIDPASFTTVRMVSGAAMLVAISGFQSLTTRGALAGDGPALRVPVPAAPGWRSALALFAYAVAFSFAYLSLTTGTGALILFGSVQTTMLISALRSGERPRSFEWIGLASAVLGLTVLVFPGLSAPPILGSGLMALAGISWGLYSLWGRGTPNPLAATTTNFVRVAPLAVVVSIVAFGLLTVHASSRGIVLATLSGAVASGMGYVIWYAALRGLTAMKAAIVQLAVPVLAALGGVLFLSESISLRLVAAATMILGGIGLAVVTSRR